MTTASKIVTLTYIVFANLIGIGALWGTGDTGLLATFCLCSAGIVTGLTMRAWDEVPND